MLADLPHFINARRYLAPLSIVGLAFAALGLGLTGAISAHANAYWRLDLPIPRALGFTLVRTETRPPEAPAETGRLMVWERTEPITEAISQAEIRRPGPSTESARALEGRRSEPQS